LIRHSPHAIAPREQDGPLAPEALLDDVGHGRANSLCRYAGGSVPRCGSPSARAITRWYREKARVKTSLAATGEGPGHGRGVPPDLDHGSKISSKMRCGFAPAEITESQDVDHRRLHLAAGPLLPARRAARCLELLSWPGRFQLVPPLAGRPPSEIDWEILLPPSDRIGPRGGSAGVAAEPWCEGCCPVGPSLLRAPRAAMPRRI